MHKKDCNFDVKSKVRKTLLPKETQIKAQKSKFIADLRVNGAKVSRALKSSGLERNTAYRHRRSDPEFDEAWRNAQEEYYDEIYGKA